MHPNDDHGVGSATRRRTGITAPPRMATLFAVLATAAAVHVTAETQTAPSPQQPVFRTDVDVVIVEATVVDRSGQIARDLQPSDFQVEIGGRAREVVSAELVEYAPPSTAVRPDVNVSSNMELASSRTLLLVADQSSLGPEARELLNAAKTWLRTLGPTDRVGFVALPPPGPQVEFTTAHREIEAALDRVVPQPTESQLFLRRTVSLWEALQIADGDLTTLGEVLARECREGDILCEPEVQDAARSIAMEARARVQPTLAALRNLIRAMRVLPGPKHVLLISGGWAITEGQETIELEPLASAAAEANATVHALLVELSSVSASVARPSPRSALDRELVLASVETLSSWTGGRSIRVAGTGDAALRTVSGALSGYYRLGVRAARTDLDGRPHRISVKVSRSGLSVRTHRRVMAGAPRAEITDAATPESELRGAILSPALATDVGLRATTYVLHEERAGGPLRVLVAAEIHGAAPGGAKLHVVLFDRNGRLVTAGEQELQIADTGAGELRASLAALPGEYLLRVAIRDAQGRLGSVQHGVDARWRGIGSLQTTGLSLFRAARQPGSPPVPVVDTITAGERLVAQIALEGAGPGAGLEFTVTRDGAAEPLMRLPGRAGKAPSGRRIVQESIEASLLPPGRYTIAVTAGGTPTSLVRNIVVTPAEVTATGAPAPAAATAVPPPVAPMSLVRPPRLDLNAVLAPDRIAPILEQMAARPDLAAVREHLAGIKQGPWTKETGTDLAAAPLAARFVAGLASLQGGDLEGAAQEFRRALRAAPDFVPALTYLGVCYAAGGKDREAASAWQTALLRERDAAWLHRLAIEAWLRAGRPAAALTLIRQARARFADQASFAKLEARATLADGRRREALDLIAAMPEPDADLLLLGLATLYSVASDGEPVWDAVRDREMLRSWRDAYAARQGESLALVDAWMAALEGAR